MAVDSYGTCMENFYWEDEDSSFIADRGTNNLNCLEDGGCKKAEKNHFCSSQNLPECRQCPKSCRRKKKSGDIYERPEPACPLIQSGAVDFCRGIPVTTPIVFSELLAHSPCEYALPPPPKVPEIKGIPCGEAPFDRRYAPEEDILGEHDYTAIAIEQKSKQAREDLGLLAEIGGKVYPGIVRLLEIISKSATTEIMQAKRRAQVAMNRPVKQCDSGKRRVPICPAKRLLKSMMPEACPVMKNSFEASAPPECEMLCSPEPCPTSKGYGFPLPKNPTLENQFRKNRSENESYDDYQQATIWQKPPKPGRRTCPMSKPCANYQTKAPPTPIQCPLMKSFADAYPGSENSKSSNWPKHREMSCPPCQYQCPRNECGQQPLNQCDNLTKSSPLAAQFYELPLSRGGEAFLKSPRSKSPGVCGKNPLGCNMNSQIVANQPTEDPTQMVAQDSKQQYDLVYKKLFDDTVNVLQKSSLGESQGSASDWGNANYNNYFGSSSSL